MDWIRRQEHQSPNAKINYTPSGAQVICTPDEFEQNTFFAVQLQGESVTVGAGTINGIVPQVKGVPITGSINPASPPPKIKLIAPDENGVVLICIQTNHKANGGLDTATIVPKLQKELPGSLRADFALGTSGYIPIALIRHDLQTRKPVSVFQHSTHNLQVRAYSSSNGTRIVYWAA